MFCLLSVTLNNTCNKLQFYMTNRIECLKSVLFMKISIALMLYIKTFSSYEQYRNTNTILDTSTACSRCRQMLCCAWPASARTTLKDYHLRYGVCEWVWVSECVCVWVGGCVWVGEWVSVCGWVWVSDWVWVCGWVSECEWVCGCESVCVTVGGWVGGWVSECGWVGVCVGGGVCVCWGRGERVWESLNEGLAVVSASVCLTVCGCICVSVHYPPYCLSRTHFRKRIILYSTSEWRLCTHRDLRVAYTVVDEGVVIIDIAKRVKHEQLWNFNDFGSELWPLILSLLHT